MPNPKLANNKNYALRKARPSFNPLFPSRGYGPSKAAKVYRYKSDGTISGVAKKAAYLPRKAYNEYTMARQELKKKRPGYGKFDFEVQ
jgi:hypothetical protein